MIEFPQPQNWEPQSSGVFWNPNFKCIFNYQKKCWKILAFILECIEHWNHKINPPLKISKTAEIINLHYCNRCSVKIDRYILVQLSLATVALLPQTEYIPNLFIITTNVACNAGDLPSMWETWVPSLGWEDLWRRERLPIPVFWPGEFHGLYSPYGCKESDTTEQISLSAK